MPNKQATGSSQPQEVAVVGAGPGGYVAAIRLAQLGQRVTLIEANPSLGGTCLNWGCIPSKALLHYSQLYYQLKNNQFHATGLRVHAPELDWSTLLQWKQQLIGRLSQGIQGLLKRHQVNLIQAQASLNLSEAKSEKPWTLTLALQDNSKENREFDTILWASGASPVALPMLTVDGQRILDSKNVFELSSLPESLLIVGAGVIGLEMATLFANLEVPVTVLEAQQSLLPQWEPNGVATVRKSLEQKGVRFLLGCQLKTVTQHANDNEAIEVAYNNTANGTTENLQVSHILVATGRKANTQGLPIDKLSLACNKQGALLINEQCQTSVQGLYAIGDCTEGPQLAHRASHQGQIAAAVIAGHSEARCDWAALPQVVYTQPALAQVGLNWLQLTEQESDLRIGRFPWSALGKAAVLQSTEGQVFLAGQGNHAKLVSAHLCGPDADNLIGHLGHSIEMGASLEDIALTIQPHPSLVEALPEAAEAAFHRAIHLYQSPAK